PQPIPDLHGERNLSLAGHDTLHTETVKRVALGVKKWSGEEGVIRPWRRRGWGVLLLLLVSVGTGRGEAGHELSFYPSFYPQEVKISVLDRGAAAPLLAKKSLHAYIGRDPFASGSAPAHVAYAPSFGSYVVLTYARPTAAYVDAPSRCAGAARVLRALAATRTDVVVHPYPVTPYHGDYVQHVDLAVALRKKLEQEAPGVGPRVRAPAKLAEALRSAGVRVVDAEADAVLEEIPLHDLLAAQTTSLNGWSAPPWGKHGWFHAALLLMGTGADPTARRQAREAMSQRASGELGSAVDRVNVERKLVSLLARGCDRAVLGYTLRREAYNTDYSDGVENLAYDAQAGLGSGMFLRTVKLKDFPWNGWLHLGTEAKPTSAWNPMGGFADPTGRIIWLAAGDPAFLPAPRASDWVANRVRPLSLESPGLPIEVPADALSPDRSTGVLRAVGSGARAQTRIVYRALGSTFHDGAKLSSADLLYPFAFGVRWGGKDPAIDRAIAELRTRLVGLRVARIDTEMKVFGDVQVMYEFPQVEVYLRGALDPGETPTIAPPWSALPWQLTVALEEAVIRGLAAFSEEEAKRRGVPWLDLVRDRKLRETVVSVADGFERRGWVPEAVRGLVSVDQARQRWASLKRFARKQGHLLLTNGPYQLASWTEDAVVLAAFRDFSYPLGVGAYDRFALPVRAFVGRSEQRGDRLEIEAEVERITKFERSYKIVREPFRRAPAGEIAQEPVPVAHFVAVGPGDEVAAVGTSSELDGNTLIVDLRGRLKLGAYRVTLALALNGNLVNPEVKVVPYRVGD
ncbi:MAG: hypothetical protein ACREKS_09860, partial [Candidatus Rokuibacteriota bacterium]